MVRLIKSDEKMLAATLNDLMDDLVRNEGNETIRIFRREKIDSDICIVLFHDVEKTGTGGSALGLRLVGELKRVALVHHTIWHEFKR